MEGNGRPIRRDPRDDDPWGPSFNEPAPARTGNGLRIAAFLFALMLIPVLSAALIFPGLSGQAFQSVSEIDPTQIKWMSVRMLNRAELDGGPDVGPYYAAPEDYAKLLEPLKAVPAVPDFDGAKGPWLGEYRIMVANGRRATIRFYWHRDPRNASDTPAKLRFAIGDKKYERDTAAALVLVAAAAECEARGKANP